MSGEAHASLDAFGIAWRLGATLAFVLLNGFFVAAEFALVKVRASRIDELAREGQRRARVVGHLLGHLDRYLSACQLGITISSLILGALGEPAVSVLIIAAAQALGIDVSPEARWLPIVSIGLAFTVITMLHMTLGEQAPKMWALRRAESTALHTAYALRAFSWLFGPFIVAVNAISNGMLRAAGLPADHGHESTATAEEIRSILSLSATAGHISDHEYELTQNIFRTMELEVRHIMTPRVDIAYLSLERSLEENLRVIRTASHSRYPLCEVGLDTVKGFVHTKDLLDARLDGQDVDLKSVARPPLFVSDTMSLSDFLLDLQSHRAHCAVVVDEHGTSVGLAFREDALEEIVGPLGDEFDEGERWIQKLKDQSYLVNGRLPMPELLDRLELTLPDDEDESEETVGGHVTARLGRLPTKGQSVRVGPFEATVTEMKGHRVSRVRFVFVGHEGDDAEDDEVAEASGADV